MTSPGKTRKMYFLRVLQKSNAWRGLAEVVSYR